MVAVVNKSEALGSNIFSQFKTGFTAQLGVWKGTKMHPIDRYLKAEMSKGAIGIRLNNKKKSCDIFIEFSIVHKIGYKNAI